MTLRPTLQPETLIWSVATLRRYFEDGSAFINLIEHGYLYDFRACNLRVVGLAPQEFSTVPRNAIFLRVRVSSQACDRLDTAFEQPPGLIETLVEFGHRSFRC